jgi:hypothetical protein
MRTYETICVMRSVAGAFRRFKDRVHAYGMAEAWYCYRDAALREMALAWCDEHSIPYAETEG